MFHDLRFDTQADRDEFASKYPLYHSVEELGEMEDDPGYYDAYSQSQNTDRAFAVSVHRQVQVAVRWISSRIRRLISPCIDLSRLLCCL